MKEQKNHSFLEATKENVFCCISGCSKQDSKGSSSLDSSFEKTHLAVESLIHEQDKLLLLFFFFFSI